VEGQASDRVEDGLRLPGQKWWPYELLSSYTCLLFHDLPLDGRVWALISFEAVPNGTSSVIFMSLEIAGRKEMAAPRVLGNEKRQGVCLR
jgi:hypothetical protein